MVFSLLAYMRVQDLSWGFARDIRWSFYVAVITDDSEGEKLAAALKDNLSAPIVYKPVVKAGLPKEILDEDDAIDAHKLNVSNVEIVKNADLFK